MSIRAQRALEAGTLDPRDVAWVALRLRQGRFSPWALAWLDLLADPRARARLGPDRALEVRQRRARRLGYRGDWEYDQVEKWFEEQGLNAF